VTTIREQSFGEVTAYEPGSARQQNFKISLHTNNL